jgi:5-(carboxyamino)imidazole ribonucleotide synthase
MRIGVLGAGQLGKMLALAGMPLGFEFVLVDQDADACGASLGQFRNHSFEDQALMQEFASMVDVVTIESENVPVDALENLAATVPVFPGPGAIAIAQDRLLEKQLFQQLDIPTPDFTEINGSQDLERAFARRNEPVLVKSRRFGYDGKGQEMLDDPSRADQVWQNIGAVPMIAEQYMTFQREVSVIAARRHNGDTRFYPLTQNEHRKGILFHSTCLAADSLQEQAQDYIRRLLDAMEYTGVLALELFDCNGQLYANEMAPRVHNSGHWTIEGAITSQFENHLRAILDMPLGDTTMRGASQMLNIVGTMPDKEAILALSGAHLHDYGKSARPGRKLGHVTVSGVDADTMHKTLQLLLQMVESA